jgi:hypothetical protein
MKEKKIIDWKAEFTIYELVLGAVILVVLVGLGVYGYVYG